MNTISNPKCEASQAGSEYFTSAVDQIERECPGASDGEKAISASSLSIAMALAEVAIALSGAVDGSPVAELIESTLEKQNR